MPKGRKASLAKTAKKEGESVDFEKKEQQAMKKRKKK